MNDSFEIAVVATLTVLASTAFACGPTGGTGESTPDGGQTSTTDSTTSGRFELTQIAPNVASKDSWFTQLGGVVLSQGQVGPRRSSTKNCSFETSARCTYIECQHNETNSEPDRVSAGTITVSDGTNNVTLDPGMNHSYSATEQNRIWDGTETLSIGATGGTVPQFRAKLEPPSDVDVQSPNPPSGETPWMLDTSSDLPVEWDGSSAESGEFRVVLGSSNDTKGTGLVCSWDVASGSGVVPASMLGRLVSGSGNFRMGPAAHTSVTAGNFDIKLQGFEIADGGTLKIE